VKVIAKRRTGIDDKEMHMIQEKVNGLLTQDEDLKLWYETSSSFLDYFKQKEKRKGFYSPKPYQMYIAAKICQRIAKGDKEKFVMMLGAGQGKTLVFLLVCMMLMKDDRTKDKFKKCCLITITKPLYTQL
jgi:type I site-specific restriction endonuclease